jgi:hypothetical protein
MLKYFPPNIASLPQVFAQYELSAQGHDYVGTSAVITSLIPAVPQSFSSKNRSMSLN